MDEVELDELLSIFNLLIYSLKDFSQEIKVSLDGTHGLILFESSVKIDRSSNLFLLNTHL